MRVVPAFHAKYTSILLSKRRRTDLRHLTTTLFIVLALGLGACSSDSQEQQPCPAKGIGVQAASGVDCATALKANEGSADSKDCLAQFQDYKKYNCTEPQIGFDTTKRKFLWELDATAAFKDINWTITNVAGSAQGKKLTVKAVGIAGDTGAECFFSTQPEIQDSSIGAGGSISMRIQYKPKTVGEFNAAVYVVTDAQNFPKMVLPVCVKVVPAAAKPDFGVPTDAGQKDKATTKTDSATSAFDCVDVTTKCNETCHAGCTAILKM
jgi:hypothetical protein